MGDDLQGVADNIDLLDRRIARVENNLTELLRRVPEPRAQRERQVRQPYQRQYSGIDLSGMKVRSFQLIFFFNFFYRQCLAASHSNGPQREASLAEGIPHSASRYCS